MVLFYRNDAHNDNFKFDIRNSYDLSDVKFEREKCQGWVDIGGFQGWAVYNFPALKICSEQAKEEMGIANEIVMICPKKTIALSKDKNGEYSLIKDLSSAEMQILDSKRKMVE